MSAPGLRERLPTLLAEVVSIVFAVLFALWVDQWWEDRENVELARRTAEAIAQEIRENRTELLSPGEAGDPAAAVAALDSAIALYREGREPESVGVNWDVTLLSSSAWETAQMTRATQYMELDRLMELARVYELQRVYSRTQDDLVALIAEIPGRMEADPLPVLVEFRSRFDLARSLRGALAREYACTLVEIEGRDAPEESECPGREAPSG